MFGLFLSARVQLMLWYLATTMALSVLFSTALYFSFTNELERGFERVRVQILAQQHGIELPAQWRSRSGDLDDPRLRQDLKNSLLYESLTVAKQAILWRLIVINVSVAGLASIVGWLVAGRTLAPIQKAHEDQKRFIADASHELRTPITALKTLLEVFLLKKRHTAGEVKELTDTALSEAKKLQFLVDKLLRLALYQGTRRQLTFSTFNFATVVESVVRTMSPLAEQKGISLKVHLEAGELQADKEKIGELISIILENAIKYTQKGSVSITAAQIKKQVTILVTDTGVGIDAASLACVFDRFYRADESRGTATESGFGLGLAVAKEIAQMHGGTITVSSQVGVGSSFCIVLPVHQKYRLVRV